MQGCRRCPYAVSQRIEEGSDLSRQVHRNAEPAIQFESSRRDVGLVAKLFGDLENLVAGLRIDTCTIVKRTIHCPDGDPRRGSYLFYAD